MLEYTGERIPKEEGDIRYEGRPFTYLFGVGDGDIVITGARPLVEAESGDITYVDCDKHLLRLQASPAAVAVAPASIVLGSKTLIHVADPLEAFVVIVRHLHGRAELPRCGIDARACVHPSVVFGAEPSVHAFASVGEGTTIGDRCRIHSGVVIGRDCRIGALHTLMQDMKKP